MKKITSLFLLFIFLVTFLQSCASFNETPITQATEVVEPKTSSVPTEGGPKKRLLVLPFLNRTTVMRDQLGAYAGDLLSDMLIRTKSFVIVPAKDLRLDARDIWVDGKIDKNRVLQAAAAAGIGAVAAGEIEDVKSVEQGDAVGLIKNRTSNVELTVKVELMDVRSRRLLVDRRTTGSVEESGMKLFFNDDTKSGDVAEASKLRRALYKAFLDIVPRIQKTTSKVDWSGRIARIEDELVYLNAGQQTGLQPEDILKVLDEGSDVFDPVSGELIGQSSGRLKGTVRIRHYFGQDGAVATVESGGNFRAGDRVELY